LTTFDIVGLSVIET